MMPSPSGQTPISPSSAPDEKAPLRSDPPDPDRIMFGLATVLQQLLTDQPWATIMPEALATMGQALQVEHVYLVQQPVAASPPPRVSNPVAAAGTWVEPAISPTGLAPAPIDFLTALQGTALPGWLTRLHQDHVIHKTAAQYSDRERQWLAPQGITSLALYPLFVETSFWGWLGLVNIAGDRPWGRGTQALLGSVIHTISRLIKQQRVEAEWRDSQQFLQLVMDNIPQFIFWKDTESRYRGCNQRWATQAEIGHPQQVVGLTDADLPWTPQQREWYVQCDREVLTTGQALLKVRHSQRLPNGQLAWRESSKLPIYDDQQRVIGVLGLSEDITAREQAEAALREQEEQFRTLVANIPGAVYRCLNDPDWTMHFISAAVADIVGYPATDFITQQRSWGALIHPEDQALVAASVNAGIATQDPYIIEYRVIHATGQVRWVYEKGQGVFAGEGELICLDGVIFDITDRKLSEASLHQSEYTNRALIEAIPDLLMRMRGDGTYIGASNSSNLNLYDPGTSFEQGTHLFDSLPRPQAERRLQFVQQALATGELQLYEQRLVCAGVVQDEEVRIVPCGEDEVLVMVRDITLRKQAEDALRQLNEELEAKVEERTAQIQQTLSELQQIQADLLRSQQRLALMVDQAPIAVIDWNTDARISGWNTAAEQIFGYPKGAAIGQPASLLVAPALLETRDLPLDQLLNRLLTRSGGGHSQHPHLTPAGDPIICDWYNTPLIDATGAVVGMASVVIDVTEREYAQAELRKSQQKMALLVQQTPLAVVEWTADAHVLAWNPAAERIFGYTAAEALGQHTTFLCREEEKPYVEQICHDLIQQRGGTHSVNPNVAKGGREIICEWFTTPLVDAEGEVVGLTSLIADVTEQKQAEESLRQSQEVLQLVIDNIPQRIFWQDRDLVYLGCNQKQAVIAGLSTPAEIIGKTDQDLAWTSALAADHQQRDRRVMALNQAELHRQEAQFLADGQPCWLDINKIPLHNQEGEVIGLLGTVEDITDRIQAEVERQRQAEALQATVQELRQTQAQLVQSEKMSSLGQLVAGVAHEINNPVSFIYGNLDYAQRYIHDLLGLLTLYQTHYPQPVAAIAAEMEAIDLEFLLADLPKMLESMKVGAERIKQIVLSLRTFSRMDEAEQKAVDIHPGIDSTVMILQHRLKADAERAEIRVIRNYSDLPKIECYPGQLNQVFMNLISNAIDALEEYMPQRLAQDPDWQPLIQIHTLAIGPAAIGIQIEDNGPGIPPALQSRIFDPFFTTKSVGKGTGMGLSISYQIVTDKHGGQLTCDSTAAGTTFKIQLPTQLARPLASPRRRT